MWKRMMKFVKKPRKSAEKLSDDLETFGPIDLDRDSRVTFFRLKRKLPHLKDEEVLAHALKALEHNNVTADELSLLVPHQANDRIIQAIANRLDLPPEKVFVNIQKYGNTSSASVPIALDEANRQGRIKDDDLVLLDAFGAGFTWGSALIRW